MRSRTDVEVVVGVFPRDDVRYPKDTNIRGVAHVCPADGAGHPSARFGLGDLRTQGLPFPVGTPFRVEVVASHDGIDYEEAFHLCSTGDEDDVERCTVGPGLVTERGRWGRKHHTGFEFGVTVMGAALSGVDPPAG